MKRLLLYALTTAISATSAGATETISPQARSLNFEQHVRPIFKAHCFHCHGEAGELNGGLDLRLVRLMQRGGDSGTAVVANDSAASLLWQRLESDEMPEGPKKLSDQQKTTIRRWIEQGAATARPEPEDVEDASFTEEELTHWAFQPVRKPQLPRIEGFDTHSPVDDFIAAGLASHNLTFSKRANRRTLLRRATFDLTGLPPTPDEVDRFVSDPAADAYERLIDRLLASPQYGVRWGRHWLDVAGFAESSGGQASDINRGHAWRYRDYVVDSFNSSKPVDQFLVEQLAGDELIEDELDIHNDRHMELLTATGFLRMAPDATQSNNTPANRNLAVADAVKVISSAMLGLTVGCAQCHDHKYEPISIKDYYQFRAIFDPIFPLDHWQQPNSQLVDFTGDDVRAVSDRIEAEAQRLEDDLKQRRDALAKEIQERKLSDVPEQDRDATRVAVLTDSAKRSERQQALLDQYPMVKPVPRIIGLLVEYDGPSYRKFEKEMEQITALRETKPPMRMIWATRERAGIVPTSAVFFRGNPESRRESVRPGELAVLRQGQEDEVTLPNNDQARPTTGRRLAYAELLTSGAHPLTARVFVNRVWLHFFGRGLVATPSDFGIAGANPTHPRLLDWLAHDFVQHGWDLKRLHRMLLLSRTYQQVSRRTARLDALDPENELYARMPLRRLEAEAIRDSILHVSQRLNNQVGGPSIPVTEDPEGKIVIGRRKIRDGLKAEVDDTQAVDLRRSIYIEVHRTLPLNVLATFDQPVMDPNCELRVSSTVATQSLWFLNDSMIVKQSTALAKLLLQAYDYDLDQAVDQLFVRMFSAQPTSAERAECLSFLKAQQQHFAQQVDGVAASKSLEQAMAALCQAMMASNRFLYVD